MNPCPHWYDQPSFKKGRGTLVTFGSYLERDHQECQEPLGLRDHLECKTRSSICITSSKKPSLVKPNHTHQHVAQQLFHGSVSASSLWAENVCVPTSLSPPSLQPLLALLPRKALAPISTCCSLFGLRASLTPTARYLLGCSLTDLCHLWVPEGRVGLVVPAGRIRENWNLEANTIHSAVGQGWEQL